MTNFFGIHDRFAQAFPKIRSLIVLVDIDGHDVQGPKETHRFDESNLPDFIKCPDRNCGGGFQVSIAVKNMADIGKARKKGWAVCSGQRGASPIGVCVTQFNYHIDIVYKVVP